MFPSPFLDAAVILINTCDDRFLESIAGSNSTRRFLPLAREIWLRCRNERKPSASPSMPELAEFIFRLSMNQDFFTRCPPDLLRKSFFGGEQSDFENFIFSYWENSPILLKNGRKEEDAISSCCNFTGSDSVDSALESILSGSVSCPPLISDELDILSFLEEVNGSLGSDMVNGQDIRVVKTLDLGSGSKKEVVLTGEEIRSKCRDAVKSGYTVALRGLEFRSMGMAGLSDGLAALFGQPSVGANVYLTPPGSQGLSRHYDDHCVFVCQLQGTKRWVVSPMSSPLLPRLYEQLRSSSGIESGGGCGGEKEFLLHRGDVLYIPRGCVHEASTTGNGRESWADTSVFSLHLTLGIEVEPPFEWEGVAHVALHCWSQNQRENCLRLAINLLHIAIGLVGDGNPLLRKASLLLASSPLSSKANPNGYFFAIIASIEAHSSFTQALEKAEAALKKDASVSLFFHRLRWLRHLSPAGVDFDCASEAFRGIPLTSDQMASLEEEFSKTKLQFCACADLEDSKRSLEMLSRRYRKVRRQYMNGMLALQPPGG